MPGKTYNLNGNKSGRSASTSSSLTVIKYESPTQGVGIPYERQTNITRYPAADFGLVVNNANEKGYRTSYITTGVVNLQPNYAGVLSGSTYTLDTKRVGSQVTISGPNDAGDTGEQRRFEDLRPTPIKLPPGNPYEYNWNLPPHKWSLPTRPEVVNEKHFSENKITAKRPSTDKYRRGRIWWKANAPIATVDSNGKVTNLSAGDANRKYGFQFMWNPETFGTQVSVQLEATPSVQDRFLGVSGAFPATETISFTLRLDRTNDFACASTTLRRLQNLMRTTGTSPNALLYSDVEELKQFYITTDSFSNADKGMELNKKIVDLLQRGTIADIEYLYRAINGPGPGGAGTSQQWTNGRGIRTADIGWLMPTLQHIDIGPLAYDGYVTNLQVNHLAFTPSMVPIRSDVTISLNLLATSSLTTTQA